MISVPPTYVTGFDSNSVEIALSVVQGVVTVLSIVGSLLLILSHVILYPLRRSKSRVLITHLAAASFLQAFPNFIAVFMDFRTRFRIDTISNPTVTNHTVTNHTSNATDNLIVCTGTRQVLDETTRVLLFMCLSRIYQSYWNSFYCILDCVYMYPLLHSGVVPQQ